MHFKEYNGNVIKKTTRREFMKTLIIYGHTNPAGSNMNKALIEVANESRLMC